MDKIAIVISVYDKFEEAALSIAILRQWEENEYKIIVVTNNPCPEFNALDADEHVVIPALPFVKQDGGEQTFFFSQDDNYYIRLRALDMVRRGCLFATERTDADWVVHLHADSWMLDEQGFLKLLKSIPDWAYIAVRGTGLGDVYKPWTSNSAMGQVDDNVFVFRRVAAKENGLWNFNVEDLLMRKYSVHGALMNVLAIKLGLRHIYYYKLLKDCYNVYGERSVDNEVKPMLFDLDYKFLHVHRGSLPYDWGKRIQAMYLLNYVRNNIYIRETEIMHEFIEKYTDWNIKRVIKQENERLNKLLCIMLYPKQIRNKTRITYKQLLIDNFGLFTFIHNIKQIAFKAIANRLYPDVDVVAMYKRLNQEKGIESWVDWWEK